MAGMTLDLYGALECGFNKKTVVLLRGFSISATASCLGVENSFHHFPAPDMLQCGTVNARNVYHTHPCHTIPLIANSLSPAAENT